jgi:putative Mn2+ efflux pump MntP
MDAFAVAIAAGVSLKRVSRRQMFRLSWHFGLFQAMMPIIGWGAGLSFRTAIARYDHWVAFGLLLFVAVNMFRSAFSEDREAVKPRDPTRGSRLVVLSVATSIDALAVGLSLSLVNVSIFLPALIIGLVAAAFTVAGLTAGSRIGRVSGLSRYADILGGVILLIIGLKILYEHGALAFIAP